MKYIYFLLLAACIVPGCNSDNEKQVDKNAISQEAVTCYTGNSGKDTIMISIIMNGRKVNGTLNYRFYEKDKNHGSINGVLKVDTLFADYTFMSEGQQSVREVAFLKSENNLSEGFGEMEVKNGKLQFKNPTNLVFGKGFILHKVDCRD